MRLDDRVAIVTGGARGIGAEICRLFAERGASVVVADVDRSAAEACAAAIRDGSADACAHQADVSDAAQVQGLVRGAIERYGKLDVMVNNAGIAAGGPLPDISSEVWHRVIAVNLNGVFYGCKYAWPHLVETRGVIVNLASVGGLAAYPGFAAYSASKAGVIGLTRVAAVEGARAGIRANALCPTWTETGMFEASLARRRDPDAARERLKAQIPLGRLGSPRDVAAAALYLASDEASFVTGLALPVDGGSLASI